MRSNPAYAENGFVLTQWSNVCVALRRQQVKSSKPVLSLSPGIRISCQQQQRGKMERGYRQGQHHTNQGWGGTSDRRKPSSQTLDNDCRKMYDKSQTETRILERRGIYVQTDFLMLVVGVVCPKAVALTPKYFKYSTAPESTLFVKVF